MRVTCSCSGKASNHPSGYFVDGASPFIAMNGSVIGLIDANIFNYDQLRSRFDTPTHSVSEMADIGYTSMNQSMLVAECDRSINSLHNTNSIVFQLIMRLGYRAATESLYPSEFAYIFLADSVLYAARDMYGIKPLYTGECLCCGRTVLASTHVELVDLKTVVCIAPFPPGSLLRLNLYTDRPNDQKVFEPFRPPMSAPEMPVLTALNESVASRASGKVTGVLVSGITSAAILHAAKRHAIDVCAFYFSCPHTEDIDRVRAACQGIQLHEIEILDTELMAAVPRAIRLIGTFETVSVRAAAVLLVGLTKVCQRRPDVTTILSGDGFSELRAYRPSIHDLHRYSGLWNDRVARSLGLSMHLPIADARVVAALRNSDPYPGDKTLCKNPAFDTISDMIWVQTEKMYHRVHMPLINRAFPESTPANSSEEVHYRLIYEDMFATRLDRAANYYDKFDWF